MNIDQSYNNAYRLYMGEIDYNDLGNEFYLPTDHEDPNIILKYYEQEEEYERCQKIITK
jgi:hypothetical protein